MARIILTDALVAGAQPLGTPAHFKRYRPSIEIERVRDSWERAHQHFSALQAGDLVSLLHGYADSAVIHHALFGELNGPEIAQAAHGFQRQIANHAITFQVEAAAAGAARIAWSASYDFLPTGRTVLIDGSTRLLLSPRGIESQVETIDRRAWSRQALGLKGTILSLLPGWRRFLEIELRLACAVENHVR
jgi:hypothetical protein